MISNQILQNTIEGLKGIARVELCVMDVDGKEVAATMDMGNCSKPAVEFAASPADSRRSRDISISRSMMSSKRSIFS